MAASIYQDDEMKRFQQEIMDSDVPTTVTPSINVGFAPHQLRSKPVGYMISAAPVRNPASLVRPSMSLHKKDDRKQIPGPSIKVPQVTKDSERRLSSKPGLSTLQMELEVKAVMEQVKARQHEMFKKQQESSNHGKLRTIKKYVRAAGGQVWEDNTLNDWEPEDFRMFCGDLGNEVTEETLARIFSAYPSFKKARVVRDKRTNKTKGFGFASFTDPNDFAKAMKEVNGRYVGNRPIKLRKSTWKDRQFEVVKKREKEKKKLGFR